MPTKNKEKSHKSLQNFREVFRKKAANLYSTSIAVEIC